MQAAGFAVPIARWSAWPEQASRQAAAHAAPDVRFIDSQLRRRLGPLARMMLHAAHDCARDLPAVRLVFASQHGELGYTVSLMRALAEQEPLSPATFSLSVHNSAAGLFSILRADRSESTALAAGDETFGHALVEGCCQLDADPQRPVLVVYADGPFPEEYRPFAEGPQESRALALLLSNEAPRTATLEVRPAGTASRSAGRQAEAFLAYLAEGRPATWTGEQRTWSWH